MASRFFPQTRKQRLTGKKGPKPGPASAMAPSGRDGTAAWPGVPGKTQSQSRDTSGTKKLRQSPREEGL